MQWWCSAQGIAWSWSWRGYPGVWLFILALAAGYLVVRRRFGGEGRGHWLAAGLLLLWLALDWPVGTLGAGYLASLHTLQLLLIAYLAPPLLLLGVPTAALRALERRRLGGRVLRGASRPLVAAAGFNLIVLVTHLPALVDGLMATQLGSLVADLSWLVAGLLLWFPVVSPVPQRPGFGEPVKMLYLFGASIPGLLPAAFLTFAHFPLYATYELAPRVEWISARSDQRVAGLTMWIFGNFIMLSAIGVLFFRWTRRGDEEDRALRAASAAPAAVGGPTRSSAAPPPSRSAGPG